MYVYVPTTHVSGITFTLKKGSQKTDPVDLGPEILVSPQSFDSQVIRQIYSLAVSQIDLPDTDASRR